MLSNLIKFLKRDIWRLRLGNYSPAKSFLLKQLRVIVLAVRGFSEDKCKFRGSALTFYSLLSIVPVVAMMFGIAKGFGFEKKVEGLILEKMEGHEEIAERLIEFSNSLLENAQGGLIAGIGILFLLWAVIKVLGNIEHSFNDIWGIKKPRSLGRKFSDYLSIMLICPIFLVMSSSMTVIISTQIKQLLQKMPLVEGVSWLVMPMLRLLPYCTIWLIFTFVFIFMPNTKVRFKSGLLAGIVAGTIFQVLQWVYITFQVGAAQYGAIYGSFAALPLFLIWLQMSWFVVLFGAELSFAHQNVDTYEFEPDCLSVSYSYKRLLSLLVMQHLVRGFCVGDRPLSASEISGRLEIPIRLVRQILYELGEAGLVSEVRGEEYKEVTYQPGCDVDMLTVRYVIESVEQHGNQDVPVTQSKEFEKLSDCVAEFRAIVENSKSNILLKDM